MFHFSSYLSNSKYYDNSNKLVIGRKKDEAWFITVGETVGLKPKIYSFSVGNHERKKAKGVNKNVVATISHNEYKEVLWNKKYLRHSMIQSKDYRIGTYEINKISLSCFDHKICIQNNGCDRLVLGY